MAKFVNVRLDDPIYRALIAYRDRLQVSVNNGSNKKLKGRVSISAAIEQLLGQQAGHYERAKLSRLRKEIEKERAAGQEAPAVNPE